MRRPVLSRARHRRERGASAVEFALVMTILLPVMLGIVDYGIWFADSLAVRQGVHEAARTGVVLNGSCSTSASQLTKIACNANTQVGSVGGPTSVLVKAPQTWLRGKPLVVCAMVQENGLTGVTPLPGRVVRARAELAVEVEDTAQMPVSPANGYWPATASSLDWSWCT